MTLLLGALTIGLILSLLAMGVFISFRIFEIPDITADGSITLGAAISAILLIHHVNPFLATAAGAAGGAVAGATTGAIHTKFKINALLAGILVMTALYSVNLHVMGRSNIPLMEATTLNSHAEDLGVRILRGETINILGWSVASADAALLFMAAASVAVTGIALYMFFRTNIGTAMRATGDNAQMVRALGANVDGYIIMGLALSNCLVGLSGALLAQYQGFADAQMGIGMIVTGLASVIIGESLTGARSLGLTIVGTIIGSVLFRLLIAIALRWGLNPNDLKFITAFFVFAALVLPKIIGHLNQEENRHRLTAMLKLTGLRKTFNPGTVNEVRALQGVDLTIAEGSFVVVLGMNGSGKSTLLNAVAGSFYVDQGRIELAGENVTRWPEHRRAKLIGRVFQNPFSGTAPNMTIAENFALATHRGKPRGLGWALSRKLMEPLRERIASLKMGLENRLDNAIGSLSGGQRQALTLLMASWLKPSLLLLDEHTAALDPKSAEQVIALTSEVIQRDRLTTLMVTHSMQQAVNLGDRIIMMNKGRVFHDFSGEEKRRFRPEDLVDRFDEIRRREQLDETAAAMLRHTYI